MTFACAVSIAVCSQAYANADLDRANQYYEEANFSTALNLLETVEHTARLSRKEVTQLFLLRALVQFAQKNDFQVAKELRRLVAIEPSYPASQSLPPDFRVKLEEAREQQLPLDLELSVRKKPGAVNISAFLKNDPGGLAHSTMIYARLRDGSWRSTAKQVLELPAGEDATVEYYGEVLGAGRLVIAHVGSKDMPRQTTVGSLPVMASTPQTWTPDTATEESSGGSSYVWWVVGGGVVVGLAAVVVVAMISQDKSNETVVNPPSLPSLLP